MNERFVSGGTRLVQSFDARRPLLAGRVSAGCRAVVTVPVRNEQDALPATLDSLRGQVDGQGIPLTGSFEVVLLLNNCTDASAMVAAEWCAAHPELTVHLCEQTFAPQDAHVGTARRWLMDTAWQRLGGHESPPGTAILTTDADTRPEPDWVFCNLSAIDAGADAVGGFIHLNEAELPEQVRAAYLADAEYQALVAELEHRLDPQDGDPWPRHLQHFGGSLACTPQIYARAGGMPAVSPLEDVAFVDRLRHIDARLRHDPRVRVHTSARLYGRVDVGLSGQLREWGAMPPQGAAHRVLSAKYLRHRFTALRDLRRFYRDGSAQGSSDRDGSDWEAFGQAGSGSQETCEHGGPRDGSGQYLRSCSGDLLPLSAARAAAETCGQFLAAIDCNRMVEGSLAAERESPIADAISELRSMLAEPAP